jgi:hypothetical protein
MLAEVSLRSTVRLTLIFLSPILELRIFAMISEYQVNKKIAILVGQVSYSWEKGNCMAEGRLKAG